MAKSAEDPFEAFRKKKEAERVEWQAAQAAALETPEEGRPAGFRRGRFRKPDAPVPVEPPKRLSVFRRNQAAGAVSPNRPAGFTRGRLEASAPVDKADLAAPAGFSRGRAEPETKAAGEVQPPAGFDAGRKFKPAPAAGAESRPQGFKRY
jgi:hypothetical protein